jgi:uncharacterized protein
MRWPRLALAVLLAGGAAMAQEAGPTEPFVVATRQGPIDLRLEIADEPQERQQGLMHRRSLAQRSGMLFDFERDGPVSMWMRNTYIPLDMLFIDGRGVIVHIEARTEPLSEATIFAGQHVRGVIELEGGAAEMLGIEVGDVVARPVFPSAS